MEKVACQFISSDAGGLCSHFTLGIEKQIARRPNIWNLLYKISKCYSTEVYTAIGARRFSSTGSGAFTAFLQRIAGCNASLSGSVEYTKYEALQSNRMFCTESFFP